MPGEMLERDLERRRLERIWSRHRPRNALNRPERASTTPVDCRSYRPRRSAPLSRLAWGSRGRRFKSCRPDGLQGGIHQVGCRPDLRLCYVLAIFNRSCSVQIGRSIERVWSKSGAPVPGPRNGVRVCSRTPATLTAVRSCWGRFGSLCLSRSRSYGRISARGARGQGVSRALLPSGSRGPAVGSARRWRR
jgi:hypothetical protein